MNRPDDNTLHANSLAVAYRLLGDRPAAQAVAGIATQMAHGSGAVDRPDWLARITEFTVAQSVGVAGIGVASPESDPLWTMRAAIRRRLAAASEDERVAGALVHLAGYDASFVSQVMGVDSAEVDRLASVIAPPPGESFRQLGDPERVGQPALGSTRSPEKRRRPHWTTVGFAVAVIVLIVVATQISGPRPTLGPVETTIPESITIVSSIPDQPTTSTTQPNTTVSAPEPTPAPEPADPDAGGGT